MHTLTLRLLVAVLVVLGWYSGSAPVVHAVIKWNPGHYMFLQTEGDNLSQSTRFSKYSDASFRLQPKLAGAMYPFAWKDLEGPTRGDYSAGIALVRREIEYLKNLKDDAGNPAPKRFVLRIRDIDYHATSISEYPDTFPKYVADAGKLVITSGGLFAKREDPQLMGWYLDMLRAYAEAFDDEPYLEMVWPIQETSYGVEGDAYTAYKEQLYRMARELRAMWQNTFVAIGTNWSPSVYNTDMENYLAYLASIGVGFGNTDTQPRRITDGYAGMRSDLIVRGQTAGTYSVRGIRYPGPPSVVPIVYCLEGTGAYRQGTYWDYTGQEVYNFINNTMRATHMFWHRNTYAGRDDQRWFDAGTRNPGGTLDAIINNPPLSNTACPTAYAGQCTSGGTTPPPTPSTCQNTLTSTASIPTGYGASYNPLTSAREYLVSVACGNGTTGTVTAGNGNPLTYVYNRGYYYSGTTWTPYTLTCASGALISGAWCPGRATASIPLPQNPTNVIAYTCQYTNNTWKCGCRDATCSTAYWQLQRVGR